MLVLEPTKLTDGDAFAGLLEFLVADGLTLARLQALGGGLMRSGDGPVPCNIFLAFLG